MCKTKCSADSIFGRIFICLLHYNAIIIPPDKTNNYIQTVTIAPITAKSGAYPTRIEIMIDVSVGRCKKCHIKITY